MKKEIYNYALNPDEKTLEQFKNCYEQKFVVKAALMPDAHLGYVAPIGSVLVTKEYIVPSWVGYDIGCGMTAVKINNKNILEKIKKNAQKIYSEVRKNVPMGLGETSSREKISEESKKKFVKLVEKLKNGVYNKNILNFLEKGNAIKHIGTLGHGNHFIEISYNKDDAWIVVHSGSRGVGHRIATEYMKKSAGAEKEFEQTYPLHESSDIGKEYLNILDFGLEFALLNRIEIIKNVVKSVEKVLGEKVKYSLWVNKNHNHAIKEKDFYIHRKGATPAKKNERGVIPANMKDGSFLVKGLGNEKFLESSSHGAGRALSRKEAKEKISLEHFKKEMKGITGTVMESTLDEAPDAYKNIFEVMEAQKDSVKVLKQLKPIINWKGLERNSRK